MRITARLWAPDRRPCAGRRLRVRCGRVAQNAGFWHLAGAAGFIADEVRGCPRSGVPALGR
jgi:hypothetical protein